ncbi:MAG: TetM/TetW/TetO/TetS family tetracycline resistance ribosomal protection protein [Eubacteriales bacterium]|nr:TetM/TetW/TetO/TetS family tetracycline resistance ribosomal protection protein [Eubacteriales bacterium]
MQNNKKSKNQNMVLGILAHVDAGKTTLAESMLYLCKNIRKMGRVDHKDAFLDNYEMERSRGITIFSKQAELTLGERPVTLLDTPGHADFSAEMERTLQVLDAAVMVISAADGVRGHDLVLWKLLKQYRIPTFLFINKMDQEGTNPKRLMQELTTKLDDGCVDFGCEDTQEFYEKLALCEEALLEEHLEHERITQDSIRRAVMARNVFPCFFGSALKTQGVQELLSGMEHYIGERQYPQEFCARVYKISRDARGERLTHLKITGGALKVKMPIQTGKDADGMEKVDQIRIYSGEGYRMVQEAEAGRICTVSGWQNSYCGQGLGSEPEGEMPVLEPVLSYSIGLEPGSDVHGAYLRLQQLEEEEPTLRMVWDEEAQEIRVMVMGEVQIEILEHLIAERFAMKVSFDSGSIVYRETIAAPVEGVGHFEPLRHYAEVHLLMEPGERGSGLEIAADCSEDVLDKNWQRLIVTHLLEKQHRGVLTGAEITDMRITLKSGKAHLKHTEGGDFRQATYRAVRQGLRSTQSILLEPYYQFRLEIPTECVGRAMSDVTRMHGECSMPETDGELSILTGSAPVSEMWDYHREVIAYTRGAGRLFCTLKGYDVCHNADQVIAQKNYDPEQDLANPTGSVFCAHGAGFVVPWDEVPTHMHLESCLQPKRRETEFTAQAHFAPGNIGGDSWQGDKELEEIFNRTYGSGKENRSGWGRSRFAGSYERRVEAGPVKRSAPKEALKEYLLVDGYNIIFAWDELRELAAVNVEGARGLLMDILSNYQGYRRMTVIVVFDAYKVEGGVQENMKYHNIYVVYTKEAETADQYIEKTVHEIGKKYHVTVATSDLQEQRIIWGEGAARMSARELREEIERTRAEIRRDYTEQNTSGGNRLFASLPGDLAAYMEEVRLGRKKFE